MSEIARINLQPLVRAALAESIDIDKFDNIEEGATADQTKEEIKTAYESNVNTNAFTDDEKLKLSKVPLDTNQILNDINTLLQSDDSDLDKLQEIVDYIKQNKDLLDTLSVNNILGLETALNSKVNNSQVLTNVPAGAKFTDTVYTHPGGRNPHGATKSDIGLGNVDNTADINKPVSNPQSLALAKKLDVATYIADNEDVEW